MERRSFLRWAAGAGVLGTLAAKIGLSYPIYGSQGGNSEPPADGYQAPEWLRYARTVYCEGYGPPLYPPTNDFDAKRLVDIVAELGGNLLRFQPVGHTISYPSKVFPEAAALGGRDLIDEVSRECRRAGIYLYCYMMWGTFSFLPGEWVVNDPRYADWFLRDPDGKAYGTNPPGYGWNITIPRICLTGDAFRQAFRRIIREYCAHDIDGVYFDAPSSFQASGVCFCESCRKKFTNFTGMDLLRLANVRDLNRLPGDVDMKALVNWYEWAQHETKEDLIELRKIIHGSGKFMLIHGGADGWRGTTLPGQDLFADGVMEENKGEIYRCLANSLLHASSVRRYKKAAQVYMGSYATSWFHQPPHDHPWVLNDASMEDSDEVRMMGFADLACGTSPMYLSANRLYFGIGSGSAEPAKDVFAVMRRVEAIHKDSVPIPYVSIVPTWASLQRWRTRGSTWNTMMTESMVLTMLDARISVDVYPNTEMTAEWLNQQRIIALCGASGISEEDARKLGEWVKRGGGLLATYDTGLYDENGQLRQDGGALRNVLGVDMKGEPLDSQPECYYRVQQNHTALGEYGKGTVAHGDGQLVPVEVRKGATLLADCWNLGTKEVRGPAVVANSFGAGKTIYVAGSLEAEYLSSRVPSMRRLLASMVRFLGAGTPMPFALSAPRGVYALLRRSQNGDLTLWVLANVGFKDADAGYMRQEYVPVSNVVVGVRVPEGRRVAAVELVRAQEAVPFRVENGYAVTTIRQVHIAEIVHFKLS